MKQAPPGLPPDMRGFQEAFQMSELALTTPRPAAALLAAPAKRPFAALLLLCLLAWLPGFASLPVLDRDEARFAQASKQMVETGNPVDIRFGTAPRYKKPAGIYWLQAASTKLLGHAPYTAIWTYRLPSLLGAIAAVFLAFWCFRALAPPETAFTGAALLALTLALTAEAHIAKTDAVLLACILAAQGVLLRIYLAARVKAEKPGIALAMAGWAALALGILVKGPVILAVIGLTALALSVWDREWRWLAATRPLRGVLLTLAIVLPWFVAIGFESHGLFYRQALGHDFAGKLVGGEESHGALPGYYVILSTLTLWPATLFALPGIGAAIEARKQAGFRYLLAWAGASWLMFALVPTKLPHYILPVYPALACMAALWLMREDASETRGQKYLRWLACVQFVLGTIILAAGVAIAPQVYGTGAPLWLTALAVLGGISGLVAAALLLVRARFAALLAAAVAALILYPSLMWGTAPRLTKIWVSPRLAALVEKDSLPNDPPVVTAGYDEPSLIFLLGAGTRIAPGADAARIAAVQGGLVLTDERQKPAFLKTLSGRGAKARAVDRLSGINYSRGKPVTITLYRVTPAP